MYAYMCACICVCVEVDVDVYFPLSFLPYFLRRDHLLNPDLDNCELQGSRCFCPPLHHHWNYRCVAVTPDFHVCAGSL